MRLQPMVVVVRAIWVGVVDEVSRGADLVVNTDVARVLDRGRRNFIWLQK